MTIEGILCGFLAVATLELSTVSSARALGTPLPIDDASEAKCKVEEIVGTFVSNPTTYKTRGNCHVYTQANENIGRRSAFWEFSFKSGGSFDVHKKIARETIELFGPGTDTTTSLGRMQSEHSCNRDPWITNAIALACTRVTYLGNFPNTQDDRYYDKAIQEQLLHLFNRCRELPPRPLSSLLDTRQQAAIDGQHKKFHQSQQLAQGARRTPDTSFGAGLVPIIRAPVGGQRFPAMTAVPIKLGAPQGMAVSGYVVRVERKDSQGKWVAQATLPVSPATAGSPFGYTGFGAGAPPCCAGTPGAWRISAQVSSPRQSGWSDWVEFVVMAPVQQDPQKPVSPKLTQPPTRAF
jgi:hypothetical protein